MNPNFWPFYGNEWRFTVKNLNIQFWALAVAVEDVCFGIEICWICSITSSLYWMSGRYRPLHWNGLQDGACNSIEGLLLLDNMKYVAINFHSVLTCCIRLSVCISCNNLAIDLNRLNWERHSVCAIGWRSLIRKAAILTVLLNFLAKNWGRGKYVRFSWGYRLWEPNREEYLLDRKDFQKSNALFENNITIWEGVRDDLETALHCFEISR